VDRVLSLCATAAICVVFANPANAGDAAHGKALFTVNCSVCHNADKDGANKIGPNLFGVAGRAAASHPGFNYSTAMKSAGIAWTPDKLATYLVAPQKMLPGVKMTFAGFANPADAQDVVSYLCTLQEDANARTSQGDGVSNRAADASAVGGDGHTTGSAARHRLQ
jgi:cytochrome c